jgi:DNA-binding Lrp family transcriptional regulator
MVSASQERVRSLAMDAERAGCVLSIGQLARRAEISYERCASLVRRLRDAGIEIPRRSRLYSCSAYHAAEVAELDARVLDAVQDLSARLDYPPVLADLSAALGGLSHSRILRAVRRLRERGAIAPLRYPREWGVRLPGDERMRPLAGRRRR